MYMTRQGSNLILEGLNESGNKLSAKQQKAVQLALKNLIFKMGECRIASDQFKYAGMSNDQMAEAMSEADPKYDYEVETFTEKHNVMGKVAYHVMMKVPK